MNLPSKSSKLAYRATLNVQPLRSTRNVQPSPETFALALKPEILRTRQISITRAENFVSECTNFERIIQPESSHRIALKYRSVSASFVCNEVCVNCCVPSCNLNRGARKTTKYNHGKINKWTHMHQILNARVLLLHNLPNQGERLLVNLLDFGTLSRNNAKKRVMPKPSNIHAHPGTRSLATMGSLTKLAHYERLTQTDG